MSNEKNNFFPMSVPVIVLACVFLVLCLCIWTAFKSRQQKVALNPLQRVPTIFVVFPRLSRAELVDVVFHNAENSSRVYVGVGQPCDVQVHTRSLNVIPGDRTLARELVIEQLYANEDFILCVDENTWLLPGWDTQLLRSVAAVKSHGVVSQFPALFDVHVAYGTTTTFPVFQTFGKQKTLPVFQARLTLAEGSQKQPRAFETGLASFSCLFGAAEVVLPLLQAPNLSDLSRVEENMLLSLELWHRHLKVVTPSFNVAVLLPKLPSKAPQQSVARPQVARVLQHLFFGSPLKKPHPYMDKNPRDGNPRDFFSWIGVDMHLKRAFGHAFLGLLNGSTNDDILYRWGSMEHFHRNRNLISSDGV